MRLILFGRQMVNKSRLPATGMGTSISLSCLPMEALIDTASYYLGLENFSMQQVLEARIME